MTFDLQEYESWKATYPGLPHILPFLRYKRQKKLEEIRERIRSEWPRRILVVESQEYEREVVGGDLS